MTKFKLGLIVLELAAIIAFRLVLILRRDKALPKGSKVIRINDIPVYKFPLVGRRSKRRAPWTPPIKDD